MLSVDNIYIIILWSKTYRCWVYNSLPNLDSTFDCNIVEARLRGSSSNKRIGQVQFVGALLKLFYPDIGTGDNWVLFSIRNINFKTGETSRNYHGMGEQLNQYSTYVLTPSAFWGNWLCRVASAVNTANDTDVDRIIAVISRRHLPAYYLVCFIDESGYTRGTMFNELAATSSYRLARDIADV